MYQTIGCTQILHIFDHITLDCIHGESSCQDKWGQYVEDHNLYEQRKKPTTLNMNYIQQDNSNKNIA